MQQSRHIFYFLECNSTRKLPEGRLLDEVDVAHGCIAYKKTSHCMEVVVLIYYLLQRLIKKLTFNNIKRISFRILYVNFNLFLTFCLLNIKVKNTKILKYLTGKLSSQYNITNLNGRVLDVHINFY